MTTMEKRARAGTLRRGGFTHRQIAYELGVNKDTIARWTDPALALRRIEYRRQYVAERRRQLALPIPDVTPFDERYRLATEDANGSCPIECGQILKLADNECVHGRLPGDRTPVCGCWEVAA